MPPETASELLRRYLEGKERGETISFERFCAAHPDHAAELRTLLASASAEDLDVGVTLDASAPGVAGATESALVESLRSCAPISARYRPKGEIATGGMGVILRVWDQHLRRHLAMKVLLEEVKQQPARQSRFLEEAQVTGQLEHPGIVPVHELGIDERGRCFFTMKLVNGITLADVFEKAGVGADGWNRTRVLSVILRVCEAMEFAHAKGVIHRDLKPSNVMVGKFGETYVMDWGLARVLGRSDSKNVRIAPDQTVSEVRTDRREGSSATSGSPLMTMDGDVVGTPCYMAPEQAQGDLERVGVQSDVYAIGAMLYHLLTGRMPFVEPGTHPSAHAILAMVLHAPPAPIHAFTKDVPVELEAIVDKAMARSLTARYRSMTELAHDLRAFLERRVVKAYETGALAEMRKWVVRNRGLAAAAAVAILTAVVGFVVVSVTNVALREANAEAKRARDAESARAAEAAARKREFDQLAGVVLLKDALAAEESLYPAWPEQVRAMEHWLANDARKLAELVPALAMTIADLESRALPDPTNDGTGRPVSKISAAGSRSFRFAKDEDRFLHGTLSTLSADIASFQSDVKSGVERRLAWARRIGDLTLHHPNARVSWDVARAAIARADGVSASTLYAATPIDLNPQWGLVPLGMNPATKLWEFYDLRSACDLVAGEDPATIEIPTHDEDGSIDVGVKTGIVFVLIPGGTSWHGAQSEDPSKPNFDSNAPDDTRLQSVALAPFFIARHEMTRSQWKRLTDGGTPSTNAIGGKYPGDSNGITWTCPVESVSWFDCERWLPRHGLDLPTEAQWECAARGGTITPWWTGAEASSLAGAANVLDQKAAHNVPEWGRPIGEFDDGFVGIAPVGSFRANPFGLFDTAGNAWEWCADAYSVEYAAPRAGDGLRSPDPGAAVFRVNRGGGFSNDAGAARSANRYRNNPSVRAFVGGVRAARAVR